LKQILPAGVALATSMAFARLVRESELTAIRSAGCSIRRVILPVLVFGVAMSILSFYTVEKFQPPAEQRFNRILRDAAMVGSAPAIVNNVMLKVGPRGTVYFSSVASTPTGANITECMHVEQLGNGRLSIGIAERGTFERGVWTFPNMIRREFKGEEMVSMKVEKFIIDEAITLDDVIAASNAPEQSIEELKKFIERTRTIGGDTRIQEIALHTRYSLPAACFCFSLAGPVMAILFGRNGGFVGVFVSIVLVMLYLNAYVISTEIFARNGWVSPIVGAWLPNVIYLVAGILGLRRLE
jgi:lipopolysaccharide export system permease protein